LQGLELTGYAIQARPQFMHVIPAFFSQESKPGQIHASNSMSAAPWWRSALARGVQHAALARGVNLVHNLPQPSQGSFSAQLPSLGGFSFVT